MGNLSSCRGRHPLSHHGPNKPTNLLPFASKMSDSRPTCRLKLDRMARLSSRDAKQSNCTPLSPYLSFYQRVTSFGAVLMVCLRVLTGPKPAPWMPRSRSSLRTLRLPFSVIQRNCFHCKRRDSEARRTQRAKREDPCWRCGLSIQVSHFCIRTNCGAEGKSGWIGVPIRLARTAGTKGRECCPRSPTLAAPTRPV